MAQRKEYTPEQIVSLLRQVEVAVASGKTTAQASKEALISVQYDVDPLGWTAFRSSISGSTARSRRGGGNVEIVF